MEDETRTLGARVRAAMPKSVKRFSTQLVGRRQQMLIMAIIMLMATVSILNPAFLTINNMLNVLQQLSIDAIMAAGMTIVIISAGIDLSVGSVLAIGAMATGGLLKADMPAPVAIAGGLGIGLAVGALNGAAITLARVPPFIMTLGMLNVARGIVLFLTGGNSLFGFPKGFTFLGKGSIGPVPMLVLITVLVYALLYLALNKTRFGRYTFAVGNNAETARLMGIRVRWHTIKLYALSGMLAAFAGILEAARLNTAQTLAGTGAELDVIAAVVIGGTSLYGGTGSIFGTILGTFFLRIVHNTLNILGVSPFLQQVTVGGLLIFSALADYLARER